MPDVSRRLVVKITAGPEALEWCSQGLTVAATGVAAGLEVSLWLTGEASWLATPTGADGWELLHAARPADLRDAVLAAGTVTLCTQCAARRGLGEPDLLAGVRIAGAAVFVEEATAEATTALVY